MPPLLTRWRENVLWYGGMLRAAPAARALSAACLMFFLVQRLSDGVEVLHGVSFGRVLQLQFGLCPALLVEGFFWQPVTYMFLHGNLLHVLLNTLTLLLVGAMLELELGAGKFLRIFLAGGIIGGLAWALFVWGVAQLDVHGVAQGHSWLQTAIVWLHAQRGLNVEGIPVCVGASGGIFALIGAYAALFPRRRMVLFVGWPVVVSARLAAVLLGIGTVAFAALGLGNIAYLTHLAGGLTGYAYGRRLAATGWGADDDGRA